MDQRSRQTIPLGEQLHWHRQHAKLSRRQLAERAGVAISTIQHLEAGHGTLTYYTHVLRALGLKLHAQRLGNRKLGSALRSERSDQAISRRELARHLEVSPTTLAKLDGNKSVRIATIEKYARAIGVSLVVRPLLPDASRTTPSASRGRR